MVAGAGVRGVAELNSGPTPGSGWRFSGRMILSEVGMMALSKDRRTEQMLGVGDGQSYVLAVESGETVRVYTVPGR